DCVHAGRLRNRPSVAGCSGSGKGADEGDARVAQVGVPMRPRFLLLGLAFVAPCAFAGDDPDKARLLELQTRVIKQEFKDDKLRRELLVFAREQVGTPLYAKAIEALKPCPAPIDRLDVNAIEEEDRIVVGIDKLVGYVRPHARAVASLA